MLLPIDYEIPERVSTELAFATERGAVKADNLTKENLTMANAGIMQVKAYCAATSNPPMADSGVFASGVEANLTTCSLTKGTWDMSSSPR